MFCLENKNHREVKEVKDHKNKTHRNVDTVENGRSTVLLSDLGVRKEVANCCLPFKKTVHSMYLTKSTVLTD